MEFQKNRPTFKFKAIRCHLSIFKVNIPTFQQVCATIKPLKEVIPFCDSVVQVHERRLVSLRSHRQSHQSLQIIETATVKFFFLLFLVENFVILNQPKIHELKKFRMLTFSLFAEARTYKIFFKKLQFFSFLPQIFFPYERKIAHSKFRQHRQMGSGETVQTPDGQGNSGGIYQQIAH